MDAEHQGRKGPGPDLQPNPTSTLRPGTMGVLVIVFFVVATSSPLASALGNVPLIIGLGDGVGAPGAYLLAGIVLSLFAVGYAAMSHRITNAGAFYAYVTAGMGRTAGVTAGWLANFSYNALAIFTIGYVGFFAQYVFKAELSIDLPWEVYAFGGLAIVTALGFRGIELNARLLQIFLTLEVVLLLAVDTAVLIEHGFSSFSLSSFSPTEIFSGAPGVAMTFAFLSFIGFEATAIFSEEAKDPRRTVPRATYVAVFFITALYTVTSWAMVASQPAEKLKEAALAEPASFLPGIASTNLGSWSSHVMTWLLLTSVFAILIAIHNMCSRYLFAFGRAGIFPSALGKTHKRFRTPYIAGFTQAIGVALVVAIFAIAGSDPYLNMAATSAGVGTLGILALMALTSVAVLFYFHAHSHEAGILTRIVAPVLSFLGLVTACVLILDNFSTVTGSESWVVTHLPWLLVGVVLVGLISAHFRPGHRPVDLFELEQEEEATNPASS